ncbi:MAG: amidohydrolase family protein, partial [Actinomycetota bacterium]|nr:amidohydrolase family protein [Actinomycetota bacterium]
MKTRVVLNSPLGPPVVRDVVDGVWQTSTGDAETVLGDGLWALPGLVDAHSHLASAELNYAPGILEDAKQRAREAVAAGVMLVMDKGWADTTTVQVAEQVPSGERPDIDAAAHILAVPEGYYPNFAREVDPSSIAEVAMDEASLGLGWVKLIGDWPRRGRGPVANFTESELEAAVSAAEAVGSKVAIHTMARDVPSAAVAAGVHSIEHGLFLTEHDVGVLGSRSGMWVPTVLRMDETIAQIGAESTGGRLLSEGLANVEHLLPLAIEAGVHVLAGTDLIGAPADVADEAIRLHSAGMTVR